MNPVHEKTFWSMSGMYKTGIIYDRLQMSKNSTENKKLDCV